MKFVSEGPGWGLPDADLYHFLVFLRVLRVLRGSMFLMSC